MERARESGAWSGLGGAVWVERSGWSARGGAGWESVMFAKKGWGKKEKS